MAQDRHTPKKSTPNREGGKPCTISKLKPLVALAALLWVGSVAGGGDQGPEDIKDFVRQIYVHGIPFEQASRYGASAVPALLEMLQNPEEQAHWPNIVTTLGMIGDKSAVEPLLKFFDGARPPAPRPGAGCGPKRAPSCPSATLIHQCESQKALEYLTTRMAPRCCRP